MLGSCGVLVRVMGKQLPAMVENANREASSQPASGRDAVQGEGCRRHMVVRIDDHGSKFLIADNLSEPVANARIAEILAGQSKPHHQTYVVYGYHPGERDELAEKLALIE